MAFASCSEDKDEPIDYNQLPMVAQNFISTYFSETTIVSITNDRDNKDQKYDVNLANGFELSFKQIGEWTDVDAPTHTVISNITI